MTMQVNDRELRMDVTPAQVRVVHAPEQVLVSLEALIMMCNPANPYAVCSRGLLFVGDETYEAVDYDPIALAMVFQRRTPQPAAQYIHGAS